MLLREKKSPPVNFEHFQSLTVVNNVKVEKYLSNKYEI